MKEKEEARFGMLWIVASVCCRATHSLPAMCCNNHKEEHPP